MRLQYGVRCWRRVVEARKPVEFTQAVLEVDWKSILTARFPGFVESGHSGNQGLDTSVERAGEDDIYWWVDGSEVLG